jgi:cysteinyl-tRNA synthetase
MAKSTGNVLLLQDVIDRGIDPLALRLCFLEHNYRQQMNLTWNAIESAATTLTRWRNKIAQWAEEPSAPMHELTRVAVVDAFNEDLDTPRAIQALRRLEKDYSVEAGARFETFNYLDRLLGLDLVREVGKPVVAQELPAGAQALLDARAQARTDKDWAASDSLRDELASLGVLVADSKDGQSWSLA